ncbi:MAG: hypothetical protein HYY18_16235 [Planctomycetes bacterium]|nr:hypothetical protein [Planctomycetota bacterium]
MKRSVRGMMFVMGAALVAGCSTDPEPAGPAVVPAATAEQKKALWEPLAALAGEWEMADDKGNKVPALNIQVSSAGSIVRERIFPGGDHEMTNIYYMDGGELVLTHYCAMGNQPSMRAKAANGNEIVFTFDGVTNLRAPDEMYMGSMKLVITDKDHIVQTWTSYKNGKADPSFEVTMNCERKK